MLTKNIRCIILTITRIKSIYDNSIFSRCSKDNENNFQWTGVQLFSHYYLSSWEVMFTSKNNKCIYVKYLHDESNKKIIINEQYFLQIYNQLLYIRNQIKFLIGNSTSITYHDWDIPSYLKKDQWKHTSQLPTTQP